MEKHIEYIRAYNISDSKLHFIFTYCRKGFLLDFKSECCRKSYCAHHSEGIFAKPSVRLAHTPHYLIFNIFFATENINYSP